MNIIVKALASSYHHIRILSRTIYREIDCRAKAESVKTGICHGEIQRSDTTTAKQHCC